MDPLLLLNGIVFNRDDLSLVIDRLELLPGRTYLLHGPNGAGKSTLLQLLALLLPPAAGELRFNGETVRGPQDRQRMRQRITLVEQDPLLFDMTVYQNLAFGLRLRDVRGDLQDRRIRQALEVV